jgi:hypothetical protein
MQVHNENILLWHHESASSRKIQKKWWLSFLITWDHWHLRFQENECTEITQTRIQDMHDKKSKHPAEDQRSFLLQGSTHSLTIHTTWHLKLKQVYWTTLTQSWIILLFHIFMSLKEDVKGQGHHLDKHEEVIVRTSWTTISWWKWHVKQWWKQQ